jgi:hypothetical protein
MRSSKSRSRSKANRNNSNQGRNLGNIINRVFDSSGPEGKVRGTPQQIIDKYNQLARDAALSHDRVAAENFQQHAEHYLRMLAEAQKEADRHREEQDRINRDRQAERDRDRERDRERAARQERESGGAPQDRENGSQQQGGQQQGGQHQGGQQQGGQPQGGQQNYRDRERDRDRNRNRDHETDLADAPQPDVVDPRGVSGEESILVETPESRPLQEKPAPIASNDGQAAEKPKAPRSRGPRKPKAEKPASDVVVSEPPASDAAE